MQNFIVFMDRGVDDPGSKNDCDISLNGGKMCLNRFCVDEDAAFEVSGVHNFQESSGDIIVWEEIELERESKGKGYASLK